MTGSIPLSELLRRLTERSARRSPRLPPEETFNEWLERMFSYQEAWIQANGDDPIDCYFCGQTHLVRRLYPEGGCAGPVDDSPPVPIVAKPVRRMFVPRPLDDLASQSRARPSGSGPKHKQSQDELDAEWETVRLYRTTLRGDF